MKWLLCVFAIFLLNSPLEAKAPKKIFAIAAEEISLYYQASGLWDLLKIDNFEIASNDLDQFIIVTASTLIKSKDTGIGQKETCIVTINKVTVEPFSVNCF